MIYPVAKSAEEFKSKWYNAQEFGARTPYGYHEADDINTKTGGDSDLGQPLYAVADGRIVYYHNLSHPNSGFGRHMVLEADTPEGKRWFHYCHCQEITSKVTDVKKGDKIGTLGKSGTKYAHLHFSCFKVDPKSMNRGIDSIAETKAGLHAHWANPIEFIEKYLNYGTDEDCENKEIPYDDGEGNRHTYGWYIREWWVEKQATKQLKSDLVDSRGEFKDLEIKLENSQRALKDVMSEHALRKVALDKALKELESRKEEKMAKKAKTMREHVETGAKYSGSSVALGLATSQILVTLVPELIEVSEALQALSTFGFNMLFIKLFKGE